MKEKKRNDSRTHPKGIITHSDNSRFRNPTKASVVSSVVPPANIHKDEVSVVVHGSTMHCFFIYFLFVCACFCLFWVFFFLLFLFLETCSFIKMKQTKEESKRELSQNQINKSKSLKMIISRWILPRYSYVNELYDSSCCCNNNIAWENYKLHCKKS